MMLRDCLDALLISGLDDWVQAAEVASIARTTGAATSEDAVRDLSLRLIRRLLDHGLMEVGTVTEQDGFTRWSISFSEAMRRIESEWRARPEGPGLGEVCWLNLTEKGQIQAQDLWSQKAKKTEDS